MNTHDLQPDPNAPKGTDYNKESDKLTALQHIIIELRVMSTYIMEGAPGATSRYWHLQGFAEGVAENMRSSDTPPGECVTWLDYVQDRLEFFESAFKYPCKR